MTPAASPLPDHVLLDAFLRDGDEAALRRLVERLTPALYRIARGLTAWRMLGAQTVVERAWQAAFRGGLAAPLDDPGLLRVLLRGIVDRSAAMGDSPHPRLATDPERAGAMRAVALLPLPSRQVYVLHDVGGLSTSWVATLLGLPLARVVSELWHARLAVETLRGNAAEPLAPDGTDESGAALDGVAPVWLEEPPAELVERICERAVHRRATLASRPLRMARRLDLAGAVLVASLALLGAGAAYGLRSVEWADPVVAAAAPPVAPLMLEGGVVIAAPHAPAAGASSAMAARPGRRSRADSTTRTRISAALTSPAPDAAAASGARVATAPALDTAATETDSVIVVPAPRGRRGGMAGARRSTTAFIDETRRFAPPPEGSEHALGVPLVE